MKRILTLCLLLTLTNTPIHAQWNIAVLPHENTVGDPEWNWLSLAISEAYVNAYQHAPKMYAVDEEYFRIKLDATRVSTSDLAEKANIHLVLSGQYEILESRIRIETSALHAQSGEVIKTFTGEASLSSPLDAILPTLFAIADQIKVSLEPEQKTAMQVPMFHNLEALRLATESQMALYQALRRSPADEDLLTQAESGLKRAIKRDAKSAMPHYYLGRIYETRKQNTEAEMAYRDALKIDFEHVAARYRLALLLKNQDRKDEAMNELEQALRQSPIDPDIQAALSGIFFNQYAQTFETITTQLREAIKTTPNDPAAYYELANAYNELDRIDEATTYYTQALERDPTLADAHFKLGLIYHRKSHHEEAVMHLQKAVKHNTQFVRVHFRLGEILHFLKRYDSAIDAFAKALEVESNYLIPRYHLGMSYLALGQSDKAFETFQQYAEFSLDDHRPYFHMAEILRQKGDYEGAIHGYNRTLDFSPVHVISHLRLAYLHAEQKRFDIAVQKLQTVLRLQPDHPGADKFRTDIQKWEQ
ncbi:MAG: tetratricopeptide repeat protein [Candidatus Latescibacteria bacterium]|nr:tetratricopeptide repeat protein [Candidatus Latescibacterota bacterium]